MSYEAIQKHRADQAAQEKAAIEQGLQELRGLLRKTPKDIAAWPLSRITQFKSTAATAQKVASKARPGRVEISDTLAMLKKFH